MALSPQAFFASFRRRTHSGGPARIGQPALADLLRRSWPWVGFWWPGLGFWCRFVGGARGARRPASAQGNFLLVEFRCETNSRLQIGFYYFMTEYPDVLQSARVYYLMLRANGTAHGHSQAERDGWPDNSEGFKIGGHYDIQLSTCKEGPGALLKLREPRCLAEESSHWWKISKQAVMSIDIFSRIEPIPDDSHHRGV